MGKRNHENSYLNQFKRALFEKYGDEYICLGVDVNRKPPRRYIIEHSCGHTYTTTRHRILNLERSCPRCSMNLKMDETSFLETLRSKFDFDKDFELVGPFKDYHTKVEILHKECNRKFLIEPNHFIMRCRCPICNKNHVKTDEDIQEFLDKFGKGEYTLKSNYQNRKTELLIEHNICHHQFKTTYQNMKRHNIVSCPECNKNLSSYAELFIEEILNKNNISFRKQFRFNDCRDKRPLPFDFAIFGEDGKLLCLIEYDGRQHDADSNYSSCSKFWKDGGLEKIILHDNIKNEFCSNNKIDLIRINRNNKKDLKIKLESIFNREIDDSTTIPWQ